MLKNKFILVGTDFSEASDLALKAAGALQKKSGGELHVVHITQDMSKSSWMWNTNLNDHPFSELEKKVLAAKYEEIKKQMERCEVSGTQEVAIGRPYKEMQKVIKKLRPGLLVLGHKGETDDSFFMGSLTDKMVSTAEIPVLVLNRPLSLNKVAGLVDPVDPVEKIFTLSQEISTSFSQKPIMISLWKDISLQDARRSPFMSSGHESYTKEERAQLVDHISKMIMEKVKGDVDLKISITEEKDMAQALINTMESEKVDLGIISRQKRGALETFVVGSVTRKVLESYPGNLLVLPPDSE